jgi:hypothetical protein
VIASARVGFDLLVAAHILIAVALVIVLVALRLGAMAAQAPDGREAARSRFPDRPDVAARLVHLLPVTGLWLVATGPAADSMGHAWVLTGLALYVVLAGWLEARALPAERELARSLRVDGDVLAAAAVFVKRLDVAFLIIALALVTMVTQF